MTDKGIDFIVQVNTGTEASPNWVTVGGQQGGTLNLSSDDIDASDKDGGGWTERLVGLLDWSIDFDALHSESDTGLSELFDEWILGNQVHVRFQLPSGDYYEGNVNISDLSIDAPHDDAATAAGTLDGAEQLEKVTV